MNEVYKIIEASNNGQNRLNLYKTVAKKKSIMIIVIKVAVTSQSECTMAAK